MKEQLSAKRANTTVLNRKSDALSTTALSPAQPASTSVRQTARPIQARFGHDFRHLACTGEQALQREKEASQESSEAELLQPPQYSTGLLSSPPPDDVPTAPSCPGHSPTGSSQSHSTGVIQKIPINPNTFFGATRPDTVVNASIAANEMRGFGTSVGTANWHTKLTYNGLRAPGAQAGHTMNPEGSGVTGVIGPDHPYGSQPNSATAAQNNHIAATLRGGQAHVAAHILNDQLGGPGVTENLFAFPGVANTLMETQVESKMKAAVAAGNYIYYQATVNHPAQGPAASITMSWNKLDTAGNDIGGGQTNVTIQATNVAANIAAVPLAGGSQAQTQSLLSPASVTAIKNSPWGPFQMPDPKNAVALGAFIDISEFPAVGNPAAFAAYLSNNRNSPLQIQVLTASLPDGTITTKIGRWIKANPAIVPVKTRRGVTKALVKDLIKGTTQKKENALIDVLATGDGTKIIPVAASEFAKSARSTARSRI